MNQFRTHASDPDELGKIICPHCGMVLMGDRGSIFLTHALSTEQEARFNAEHPAGH